jgi:hypothetical protein
MLAQCEFLMLAVLAVALSGCGVQPVAGGTKGVLRSGAVRPSDIQVTVHRLEGGVWKAVGFGITASDGTFELVTPGAQGALWLTPGDYRCTLESVGWPGLIPAEYLHEKTTPLKVSWSDAESELALDAPGLAPSGP